MHSGWQNVGLGDSCLSLYGQHIVMTLSNGFSKNFNLFWQ